MDDGSDQNEVLDEVSGSNFEDIKFMKKEFPSSKDKSYLMTGKSHLQSPSKFPLPHEESYVPCVSKYPSPGSKENYVCFMSVDTPLEIGVFSPPVILRTACEGASKANLSKKPTSPRPTSSSDFSLLEKYLRISCSKSVLKSDYMLRLKFKLGIVEGRLGGLALEKGPL
jgi:hypothetical protein